MNLKCNLPDIDTNDPFKNDLLNRRQYGEILTTLVKATEKGGTLSINAEWGYGKTTFIRMWEARLKRDGYSTIYLNAWENDYAQDPFMALVDEVLEQLKSSDFSSEKKQILLAATDILVGIAKAIPHTAFIGQIGEAIKKGVEKTWEDRIALQEYRTYKDVVNEFKDKLQSAVSKLSPDKPLIIFVDELDRCRPNYAIEFLERIKHLFSIDNIVFVLSVDKQVLLESIKCIYGSSEIQADNYLRRFIDLEFSLPVPNTEEFVQYQFNNHGLDKYIQKHRNELHHFYNTNYAALLTNILAACFRAKTRSLRDIEKYFNRLDVVLHAININGVYLDIIVFLTYLYMFEEDIFQKIYNLEYTKTELVRNIESAICMPNIDINSFESRTASSVLASILWQYEMELEYAENNTLILPRQKENLENINLSILPENYFNNIYKEAKNKMTDRALKTYCQCIRISDNFHYDYD